MLRVICALVVPVVLSTSAAVAPDESARDRQALLGDLDSVPAPGVPGRVAAFGPDAFAVLAPVRDGAPRPVIAGATVGRRGKGRVVLFGHGGYLGAGMGDTESGRALLRQSLEWAAEGLPRRARGAVTLVGADGLAGLVTELGFEVESRQTADDTPALIVLGHSRPSDAECAALLGALEKGGGLLCAATGWGWQQLNPGADIAVDLPLNRLLHRVGLTVTGGTTGRDGADGFDVAPARAAAAGEWAHAGRALEALAEDGIPAAQAKTARGVVLDAAIAVPEAEPLFGAAVAALSEERLELWRRGKSQPLSPDPRDALATSIWTRRWSGAEPAAVVAAPGHERFPGALPDSLEPTDLTLTVEAGPRGRRSLGAWAPAGAVVRVELTGGTLPPRSELRIGAHSDRLWHKPDWKRWPEISRSVPFAGEPLELASPFGGLVYIELDRPLDAELRLRIEGAAPAPLLRAGATEEEVGAFRARLDALPPDSRAPWVELVGEHVTLTVPADAARACADPAGAIDYWDRTWEAHTALLGAPIADRPERFVFDVQISAGWMHSGYPIMAHDVSARDALDLERLRREGDWGLFHELGHNSQDRAWTSGNMGEVTCNLFSLHAMEVLAGIAVADHERGGGLLPDLDRHRAAVARGAADFEAIRTKPFPMLAPFVELQLAFGWEPFTAVFSEHRAVAAEPAGDPLGLGPPKGPDRDRSVRDQWAIRFSRQVGRDVSPFLRSCAWPLSDSVTAALADLEDWTGDD